MKYFVHSLMNVSNNNDKITRHPDTTKRSFHA